MLSNGVLALLHAGGSGVHLQHCKHQNSKLNPSSPFSHKFSTLWRGNQEKREWRERKEYKNSPRYQCISKTPPNANNTLFVPYVPEAPWWPTAAPKGVKHISGPCSWSWNERKQFQQRPLFRALHESPQRNATNTTTGELISGFFFFW